MEAISGGALVETVTTVFVLATNVVAVSAVASLLVRTVPVGPAYATGFLLLAVSPGPTDDSHNWHQSLDFRVRGGGWLGVT